MKRGNVSPFWILAVVGQTVQMNKSSNITCLHSVRQWTYRTSACVPKTAQRLNWAARTSGACGARYTVKHQRRWFSNFQVTDHFSNTMTCRKKAAWCWDSGKKGRQSPCLSLSTAPPRCGVRLTPGSRGTVTGPVTPQVQALFRYHYHISEVSHFPGLVPFGLTE